MVFLLSRNRCARLLFVHYYKIALRISAFLLGAIAGVQAVYCRGGVLLRCDPGVSDIDLTIKVDDILTREQYARTLRKIFSIYRVLKRIFPVLGELIVTDTKTLCHVSKSASTLPFVASNNVKQRGTGPVKWEPFRADLVSPISRFTMCFSYYLMAVEYHAKYSRERAFHHYRARKVLSRAIAFSEQTDYSVLEGPLASLFSNALFLLNRLACEVLDDKYEDVTDVDIELPLFSDDFVLLSDTRMLSGSERSHYTKLWNLALNRSPTLEYRVSEVPWVFVIEGFNTPRSIEPLFDHYLKVMDRRHNIFPPGSPYPLIVSEEIVECVLLGGFASSPFETLHAIPPSLRQNEAWVRQMAGCRYSAMRQWLATVLFLVPAAFLWRREKSRADMAGFCHLAMAVCSKFITKNVPALLSRAQARLPRTVSLYHELAANDHASCHKLWPRFLSVKNEVMDRLLASHNPGLVTEQ